MKKILFTLAAVSLASFSFAQDFGFGDEMGGGDMGSYEEESTPAVTISGEVGAEGRAWIGTQKTDTEKYNTSGYGSFYDLSKTELDAGAYANLELNYDGDYTNANLKLKLDSTSLLDHPEDVIDELSVSGSFSDGRFQLKAGKMKEVWGKGDKIHVLDNFNANDYTDFIFPDYIDRRLGEVMFKATANLSWDYNLKLEGIFTPWMTADRFAESGMLVPYSMTHLTEEVEGIVLHNTYLAYTNDDLKTVVGNLQFSSDQLYPDNLYSIKYAQAGARLTGTLGGLDWGASYYYGHYKQPSANLGAYIDSKTTAITNATTAYVTAELTKYASDNTSSAFVNKYGEEINNYLMTNYGTAVATGAMTQQQAFQASAVAVAKGHALDWAEDGTLDESFKKDDTYKLPSLNYDQVQVFGLEAAFVLWKFNTRWEVAYNLTEDTAGDNPWVKNNWLGWVAGFDIDIPIHNLNLNVQENGTYVLKNDKIKDAAKDPTNLYATHDVDHNSDDKYINNKLIMLLSDKWLNEKLTTEVQGIWCIETKEFMVAPKIEYNVIEGLTFGCRFAYMYSDNENGEFYNFTENSKHHDKMFLQLTAKYQF
ncbi:MAG: hypothetical protein IJ158_04850 [Treponema sp.]|nr:hypothetical protein [Treponema sp.]